MTSKSLFFKLMKEDLKRRLWAVGFSLLHCLLCDADGGGHGDRRASETSTKQLARSPGPDMREDRGRMPLRHTKILRLAGESPGL